MPSWKVKEDVFAVGVQNPAMRIFDIVMRTEYGTSYNSYIVKGTNKTALIETCHLTYFKHYLENIKSVCDLKEISYIILNHCEPDHSGVLAKLMELCPNAEIIVSRAGGIYLKNITNHPDFPFHIAGEGEEIDLGGKTLRFIMAPFLHWPDSMFTYCPEDGILYSCDMFGTHFCEPHVFDYNIVYPTKYLEALKGYYDAIFAPFKPYVIKGMDKLTGLDFDTVCNSHGPILTAGNYLETVMARYREWSGPTVNEVTTVPVFYCSAYGNTAAVGKKIADGIQSQLPGAKVDMFDLNEHDIGELSVLLNTSDAFAIGSPTINADAVGPVWNLLSHVDAIGNKKKPVLVFGSYGWSGEAVPNITARLQGLKMKVFGDGMRAVFVPSEAELDKAFETGAEFAKSIG